jgi:hypothetical protein
MAEIASSKLINMRIKRTGLPDRESDKVVANLV